MEPHGESAAGASERGQPSSAPLWGLVGFHEIFEFLRGRSGVDIVVKGRNVEVPEHYRIHVADKLHKVERYDHKLIRIDVELFHERNRRQNNHCQRVEITCFSRGPVVRAAACASDFYGALDLVINKLDGQLRKVAVARLARGAARITRILDGATTTRPGAMARRITRQGEMHTGDVVAGIDGSGGSHRRVDPTRHRSQHSHCTSLAGAAGPFDGRG